MPSTPEITHEKYYEKLWRTYSLKERRSTCENINTLQLLVTFSDFSSHGFPRPRNAPKPRHTGFRIHLTSLTYSYIQDVRSTDPTNPSHWRFGISMKKNTSMKKMLLRTNLQECPTRPIKQFPHYPQIDFFLATDSSAHPEKVKVFLGVSL